MVDFATYADNQGNLKLKCTTKLVQVVERRLVIERLLTTGSIAEPAMHRCVIRKDTLRLFYLCGQAVYLLWWPSLTKDLQTELKSAMRWCGQTNT